MYFRFIIIDMAYSSIVRKRCKCGCGKWPTTGYAGYNQDCRADLKRKKLDKLAERQDAAKVRNHDNKLLPNQAKEAFEKLQQFFDNCAREIAKHPYCLECELEGKQTFIKEKFYRSATAHVLPKRKEYGFPSVAAHPVNFIVLADICGHHKLYDRSWEDAAKMKVWPLAIQKFKIMYPHIAPEEKKNIPDVLWQEIEPK